MDLLLPPSFFAWCQATDLSMWVNGSAWAFSTMRTAHLAGLAVLIAGVAEIDLRILGLTKRGQSVGDVTTATRPYIRMSLAVVVATGIVQFLSQAVRYGHSLAFIVTLALFVAAVLTHLTVVQKATGDRELAPVRYRKLAAYLSLLSWFGVAVAEQGVASLP